MKVYRYLSETELNNILNGNLDKIGKSFDTKTVANTFKYKDNVKYLHFYKHAKDMDYIRNIYNGYDSKFYFCEFNIPKLVLYFSAGKGFYEGRGFDNPFETAREYVVKVDNFNPKWLKKHVLDKNKTESFNKFEYESMFM